MGEPLIPQIHIHDEIVVQDKDVAWEKIMKAMTENQPRVGQYWTVGSSKVQGVVLLKKSDFQYFATPWEIQISRPTKKDFGFVVYQRYNA